MKKEFCLRCNKKTECLLINSTGGKIAQGKVQCLECGCEMGFMDVPEDATITFSPGWKFVR